MIYTLNITINNDRKNQTITVMVYDNNFIDFKTQWNRIDDYLHEVVEEHMHEGTRYHPLEALTIDPEWDEVNECYLPQDTHGNIHHYYFEYE